MAATERSTYAERRNDIINVRLMGAPAASAAAWLSAVDRAEREGKPCPTWEELERVAASLPIDGNVFRTSQASDES